VPAAVAVPLLILARAAEVSKEKEVIGGSTSATEAAKEKETAGGSTTAAMSGDDSFLGRGGAIVLVQHPRWLRKTLRCRFGFGFVLLGGMSLYSILLHFVT
jgi:hypothetical protein